MPTTPDSGLNASDYNWNSGAQGAVGGAEMGGSMGGGYGALAGGALGLLGGLFMNTDQNLQKQMLNDYYQSILNRQISGMGSPAQAGVGGFRQDQAGLISRLEAMASGQGPSLAAQQFQQATDRNMSSQEAMAASGRGGPMSALTASNNMAMLGANAAQGSAIARTGEEMGALGQLGSVIGQGREEDQQVSMFNAGQKNQMAMAALEARLKQMGLDDSAIQNVLQQMMQNQNRPSFGSQLMAGGAGAMALGASQRGNGAGGGGGGSGGGPLYNDNGIYDSGGNYIGNKPGGWDANGNFVGTGG